VPDTSPGCPVPSANVYVNTPVTFPVPSVDPTLATTVVLAVTPVATTKVPVSELTPFAPETKFCANPVELAVDGIGVTGNSSSLSAVLFIDK